MSKHHHSISQKLVNIAILLLVFILLAPIFTIALYIFKPSTDVWQHLVDTVLTDYLINSLLLSISVAMGTLVLGLSTAWLTTMYRFPLSKWLPLLLMLPMAMPAYIIAFTYTGILDTTGPVQHYLRQWTGLAYGEYWFPDIRNITGASIMLIFVLYPYVFLLARASFLEQSATALQVGQTLGLNAWQRFVRIALPLSRPAILAGTAMVVMETLADYGTVQYFGVSTFTTGIFRTWYGLDDLTAAANLSALLMFFVLLFFGLEIYSRRHMRYSSSGRTDAVIEPKTPSKSTQILMFVWCLLPVLIGFIVPVSQLAIWAWQNLSQIDAEFIKLCWHSFLLALITALVAVCVAFIIAAFQRHHPSKLGKNSFRLVSLGYAIPGTVVAIGVLIPASLVDKTINAISKSITGDTVGLVVGGSIALLVFAYLVRFMAVALGSVESGFGKINKSLDDAARSMKTSSFGIMTKIHLPIMYKTLLTAVLIIFVDVLKELPATLILRPFNFNTLAVRAFELASDEFLDEAALPAIFIILTGIIPVVLLNMGLNRSAKD